MVKPYYIYGCSVLLHLWANFITFMVSGFSTFVVKLLLHLWLIFITFMVVITFLGDTTVFLFRALEDLVHSFTLLPKGRDQFGLRQGSRPLAAPKTGSPRFTGSLSNLRNLIG